MNYTELIISFGDTQKLVLNSATQDGLVIKETAETITLKFVGEDPSFYVNQLERFRNRGIVITAKRDNDPRRNLRGALTSLDHESATILIGKYPVGLDIDEPQQQTDAEVGNDANGYDNSLVSQLLAKLDEQQKVIKEYETKNQPITPEIESQIFNEIHEAAKPIYKAAFEEGNKAVEAKLHEKDPESAKAFRKAFRKAIDANFEQQIKQPAEVVETQTEVAPTAVKEQVDAKPESTTKKSTGKKA